MANTPSAKKRMRQNQKRRLRNRMVRTRARTAVRRARQAIETGDPDAAKAALKAVSELDRAAIKGVIHRNNAARRKSRLMKRLAMTQKS